MATLYRTEAEKLSCSACDGDADEIERGLMPHPNRYFLTRRENGHGMYGSEQRGSSVMTIHPCKHCGATIQREQPYCEDCEYMSPQDAAKRLHVSRPTYYRLVKAGKLRPSHIGPKKTLVLRAQVDALLA